MKKDFKYERFSPSTRKIKVWPVSEMTIWHYDKFHPYSAKLITPSHCAGIMHYSDAPAFIYLHGGGSGGTAAVCLGTRIIIGLKCSTNSRNVADWLFRAVNRDRVLAEPFDRAFQNFINIMNNVFNFEIHL